MQEIAPQVYVETTYPPLTIGAILTEIGWVAVDTPPMPRDAQSWREALRHVSDKPILYIINTDANRERILGNTWFESPIVVHESTAQQMLALKGAFLSQAAEEMSANDNELVEIASLHLIPPQVSYSDALSLHCGSRTIEILHRPGPSFGNSWVVLQEEKLIFTGDSLVVNQHPTISDGNSREWLQSLLELQSYGVDWKFIPGRGEPVSAQDVPPLIDYLRVIRKRVSALCSAGKPRSELGSVAAEIIGHFPFLPSQRDEVQRRLRAGLETIYESFRSGDSEDLEE